MKKKKVFFLATVSILLIGFVLPENAVMPVEGATNKDYNKDSFWYYPWGKSVTHKGVDIFAKEGTNLRPSVSGLVLYSGNIKMGGNVILILSPKWKIHYYAHLKENFATSFSIVTNKKIIGSIGSSGNAKGKPAHLHYSIVTLIPYPWRIDSSIQGWKKMFYLNPIDLFKS